MTAIRYIVSVLLLLTVCLSAAAQKAERDYIRRGNRSYRDSMFVDADVNYRKALDANPKSAIAMYNLGNALLQQQKLQEAMDQYAAAASMEQSKEASERDKEALAQIYHNIGVIFHLQKEYAKAIEAYKQSLRNNPKDDETRYNLALAQKQLKDQQDQQQDQQDQQQDQDQQQKDDQQQQQQQDQQQQDQPQQPQPQEGQMSQENAEQMLNAVMQDEKDVQDKVNQKRQPVAGRKLEKDW